MIDPENPDPSILSTAAAAIQRGSLIAYPTDTTYGLVADPMNEKAVSRLFKVKRRALSKPILLLIGEVSHLPSLVARVSPLAEKVIKRFWPGPLTLVFEAASDLSPLLTAGTGKIGVRLPSAPLSIALIRAAGFPLTATSANISGESPSVRAGEVAAMMGDDLDLILDGGVCETMPSTLLDLSDDSPRILRQGKIPVDSLVAFFDDCGINVGAN